MIDLHAVPGSQNAMAHSGSRDGMSQDWGKTDDTIQETVDAIEFLTARYIMINFIRKITTKKLLICGQLFSIKMTISSKINIILS